MPTSVRLAERAKRDLPGLRNDGIDERLLPPLRIRDVWRGSGQRSVLSQPGLVELAGVRPAPTLSAPESMEWEELMRSRGRVLLG